MFAKIRIHYLLFIVALLASAYAAQAQSTAFTFQGKLTDMGSPANGI